jgi:GPH family glycoside/pentoside/hexuronide:cation symporter
MLNAVTTYYPVLMTTVLGQSPQLAGLLMMLSKLYDAVMDIVIGSLSDRTRSRWGRRRPYLLAGAVVSAVSFFLIFSPPVLGSVALVAYMMGALILY